jgi:formylglycine-generating enzyme required for sulfatase activity
VRGSRLTAKTVLGREWLAGHCQPTEPVDWETSNALGLQCLLGNVFEWCFDGDEKEMDLPNPSGPGTQRRKVKRFVAVGGGWASSRTWLQGESDKGTFGAILCPYGWPMRDGGFRLCFRMKAARV